MKRTIFYILLLLIISNSFGQAIEISSGANRNNYYDFQRQDGHFITDYNPDFGYSLGISMSEIKVDTLSMRISLRLDKYNGGIYTTNGGLGGASTTKAEIDKATIGFGFYPINFKILRNIQFSFGGELSFKVYDKTLGYKSSWQRESPSIYMTIENDSIKINKNIFFGLSGRISYNFKLKENWYIAPIYKFYIGLTDEFENTEAKVKSMRHNIEIGIIKKMK